MTEYALHPHTTPHTCILLLLFIDMIGKVSKHSKINSSLFQKSVLAGIIIFVIMQYICPTLSGKSRLISLQANCHRKLYSICKMRYYPFCVDLCCYFFMFWVFVGFFVGGGSFSIFFVNEQTYHKYTIQQLVLFLLFHSVLTYRHIGLHKVFSIQVQHLLSTHVTDTNY